MGSENIQKALRLTSNILNSKDLTEEQRQNIIQVEDELKNMLQQNSIDKDQFKKVLTELFEWVKLILPFLPEIIKLWTQDK